MQEPCPVAKGLLARAAMVLGAALAGDTAAIAPIAAEASTHIRTCEACRAFAAAVLDRLGALRTGLGL